MASKTVKISPSGEITTADDGEIIYGNTPNPKSDATITQDGSFNRKIDYFPEKPEDKHMIREEIGGMVVHFRENKSGKEFTAIIDKASGSNSRFYSIQFSKGFKAPVDLTSNRFMGQNEAQFNLRIWLDNPESEVTFLDCERKYHNWTR